MMFVFYFGKSEEVLFLEGWWLSFKLMDFLKTFYFRRVFWFFLLRVVLVSLMNEIFL